MSDVAASTPAGGAPAAAGGEGLLARLLRLREASILAHRYVDLKLAELGATLMLLLQAPLIGFMVGRLAYHRQKETQTLDFILVLVAVWFGAFNGCREVVKERLIFLRERRAGVPVRAYLLSKVLVLAVIAAVQCLVLVALVDAWVVLKASAPLVFLGLFTTALAATCLGLLLSSVVARSSSVLGLLVMCLIPQLVFSRATLHNAGEVVERIELTMIAHWGLELLTELRVHRSGLRWGELLGAEAALLAMSALLLVLAGIALRLQPEE